MSTGQDDGTQTTAPVEEPVVPVDPADRPQLGAQRAAWRRRQELADDEDEVYDDDYDDGPVLLPASQAASYGGSRRVGSTAAHPVTGQTLRAVLTIGLTFAVVLLVFLAVILRLPPADFAQYMAPLTGIAGLALGYWFGSDKSR